MTEEELRELIQSQFSEELPNDEQLKEWAERTGLTLEGVRAIYEEEIGEDAFGLPPGEHTDGREDDDDLNNF
jgi:hypothetical protein